MKGKSRHNAGIGIGVGSSIGVAIGFVIGQNSENSLQIVSFGLCIGILIGSIVDFCNKPK